MKTTNITSLYFVEKSDISDHENGDINGIIAELEDGRKVSISYYTTPKFKKELKLKK
jgi:hypothetical protein